jgi:hypothetical protein
MNADKRSPAFGRNQDILAQRRRGAEKRALLFLFLPQRPCAPARDTVSWYVRICIVPSEFSGKNFQLLRGSSADGRERHAAFQICEIGGICGQIRLSSPPARPPTLLLSGPSTRLAASPTLPASRTPLRSRKRRGGNRRLRRRTQMEENYMQSS